jgi:hypothetical protein
MRRQYGANWPGDLESALRSWAIEVAALTALVRPWSYRRSWLRAGIGAALFGSLGGLKLVVCMHCGPVAATDGVWMLMVSVGLAVAAFVSGTAAEREVVQPVAIEYPQR